MGTRSMQVPWPVLHAISRTPRAQDRTLESLTGLGVMSRRGLPQAAQTSVVGELQCSQNGQDQPP